MSEKAVRRGTPSGTSAASCEMVNADGRKKAKPVCRYRIGRPPICVGSSLKAVRLLNRSEIKRTPPRVKAPELVTGSW
jgi:hypothetical protein